MSRNPITWQQVAAPSINGSVEALLSGAKAFTGAINDTIGGIDKARQSSAVGEMIQRSLGYGSADDLQSAMTNGALTQGIDSRYVTPEFAKAIEGRITSARAAEQAKVNASLDQQRLGILQTDLDYRKKTYADQLEEKDLAKKDKAFSFDYANAVAKNDPLGAFILEQTNPDAFRRMGTAGVDVITGAKQGLEKQDFSQILSKINATGSPIEQDALVRAELAKITDPVVQERYKKRFAESGFAIDSPDYLAGLQKHIVAPTVTPPEQGRTSEAALSAYAASQPTVASTPVVPGTSASFVPGKLDEMLRLPPETAYQGNTLNPSAIRAIQNELGLTPEERRIQNAILSQESSNGANRKVSSDGAVGPGQMMEGTFKSYAVKGATDRSNAYHNLAASASLIKDLSRKFGGDPAKVAAGYFSGEGNVSRNPGQVYKTNAADSDRTSTSTYVSGILKRLPTTKDYDVAPTATNVLQGQVAKNAVPQGTAATATSLFNVPNGGSPEELAIRERAIGEVKNESLRKLANQVNDSHVKIGNDEAEAINLINAELPSGSKISKKDYDTLYKRIVGSRTDVSAGAFAKMVTLSMPKRGAISGFFRGDTLLADKLFNMGDTDLKIDTPVLEGLVKDFTGIEANIKEGLREVGVDRAKKTVAFGKAIDEVTTEITTLNSAIATAVMLNATNDLPKLRAKLVSAQSVLKDLQAKEQRQAGKAINLLNQ